MSEQAGGRSSEEKPLYISHMPSVFRHRSIYGYYRVHHPHYIIVSISWPGCGLKDRLTYLNMLKKTWHQVALVLTYVPYPLIHSIVSTAWILNHTTVFRKKKFHHERADIDFSEARKANEQCGGTPPPTTPLYRPQAGGPAPAIQRSSPENSPAAQRSSLKKSQGIQRKLIRHKRPHRRTTARFAAQRLFPRGRLWSRRFELMARSGEPWSQKGGTVVTLPRRVAKASDGEVSPRRLRPS